jgi:hypothetical protein
MKKPKLLTWRDHMEGALRQHKCRKREGEKRKGEERKSEGIRQADRDRHQPLASPSGVQLLPVSYHNLKKDPRTELSMGVLPKCQPYRIQELNNMAVLWH